MASQIDRAGCFRGKPAETGVGVTKNKFPQFVARLVATERFVESAEELKALGLDPASGPQWVDWSGFEQEMTGYFCLFGGVKDADGNNIPGQNKKLDFQFENLNRALGWDGASLNVLGTTNYTEKVVTFWVEEHTWNDNTSLQINGLDAADADPVKSIRALDTSALKDLDSQFAGMMNQGKAPAVTAAKAPPKPAAKAPAGKPAAAAKSVVAPAAAKPSSPATSAAPAAKGPPKKAVAVAPAAKAYSDGEAGQLEAWDATMAQRGAATDDATTEAFLNAMAAIAPGKHEGEITAAQWPQIVTKTIALLTA